MARIGDRGELEAFVRSIELGTFSAAARELGLTPSGVSKLITRLEEALGARLVHRSTRRVTASAEGELFLQRCRRVLAELEDAETEVGHSRERPRGRLRMHVAVGFAMHQVVGAMPRFFERYPEVQVDMLVEDRRVDLVRENIDISVRLWPPESPTMVVRKLFDFERILCASPGYLRRHGTPATPEDLLRHRCLTVSSIPNHADWAFESDGRAHMLHVAPAAAVNNADCVYRFALAGSGIARLNEFIVAEALADGRLLPLLPDHRAEEGLAMLAIHPQDRQRLPRVAAMLEFLAKEFGHRPWRKKQRRGATRSLGATKDR